MLSCSLVSFFFGPHCLVLLIIICWQRQVFFSDLISVCYVLAGDKKTAETGLTGAAAQQGQSTLDDGRSESR